MPPRWFCRIFGHLWHYSAPKGQLRHHEGYDDCEFCLVCGKIAKVNKK